jgi:CxxC-x17-CxxC domain-containing protein
VNNFKSGGFKKGSSFGGRPSFGGNRKPEGRSSDRGRERSSSRGPKADQEMFPATCTSCGRSCEVPFRPDGQKPVLCRECYAAKNSFDAGGVKRPERPVNKFTPKPERSFGAAPKAAPQVADAQVARLAKQIDALEAKLNRILELIETPVEVVMEELEMVSVVKPRKGVAEPTLVQDAPVVSPAKKTSAKKASVKKAAAKKAAKPAKAAKKAVKKTAKKSK